MMRTIALAAVLVAAAPAAAQESAPLRLTLEPMAAPLPALKYRLLPEVRDTRRGNALLLYYRAFSPEWQRHRRTPDYLKKLAAENDKPLRDLTAAQVDSLVKGYDPAMLKEVDRAARRSYCDWEMNARLREDGIGLLLPDLQSFRVFAGLLKMRARKELLAGRYDQAARTLQTGLALARHAAAGPTLIHTLVGVGCASAMLTVVDDWLERPGAPNLYWALTDLPRPLISARAGLDGERLSVMDWIFPGYREWLADPAAAPAPARLQASLRKYLGILEQEGAYSWAPLVVALRTYPRAKRLLLRRGRSPAEVEAMPALQAVFLYEVHEYDSAFDEMRKWLGLPYPEAAPHVRRAARRARDRSNRAALAALLLPAVERVFGRVARVDRKVAALRCIEALRLHARGHGGGLPARLAEITAVPVPPDPMTGKPFEYRLEGDRAVLTGPAPAGEKPDRANTIRYELTMRARGK
jgi:hypothetical protein